ncbi:MAG: aminotransferase class V-fold PLP-dependent enzyme [Chloroflexi bacterium]|nr:aminotransferase class V-fold PLP-dependent enzyme [Chloroflexota bacterium]
MNVSLNAPEDRHAPQRILMAPGPSNVHPRVIQALIEPLVGHKDPSFLAAMEDTAALLREVFQTRNRATFALPATGGSGMEAALVNVLEPGDTVVVANAGFFAQRMVDICTRLTGVNVVVVPGAWGEPVARDAVLSAIRQHRPRALAIVHGETSTGVEQPLEGLAAECHAQDALLVVDAVATLGGVRLPVDEWEIDVCFSGSQKCLSAPPGMAPITISDRAMRAIEARHTPVASWYFDLRLHARLWDTDHSYHHTSPVLSVYALREALRLVVEEGVDARIARHCLHAMALGQGIEALGLQQFACQGFRMPSVVTALTPAGVSARAVRKLLLDSLNVEISVGLGERSDGMWRIGVMGHSAQQANVMLVLTGLEQALRCVGLTPGGSGARAAAEVYEHTRL